jgi:hypothetical protein
MTTPTTGVGTVAGTKFFIGPAGAFPVSPDLFVEIQEISSLGDIAEAFAAVSVSSVGSGDSYNLKGVRSFPDFALVLNRKDSDPGQIALKAASESTRGTLYPFKIQEVDGGVAVWQGEVFGYGPTYGTNSSLRSVKTSISIRPSTLTITPA